MSARAQRLTGWWLSFMILCPSLVWVARNRSVWPWDQAWFARYSVELFETLRTDPLAWPAALAHATPMKPPAVAWIGQFFVPLGLSVGSVDAGLLFSIWMTHLVALMVVYRALMVLSGGRTLVATAGTLVVGAAPLFIGLSTQYFAEPSQTLAVAWFVLIMVRAPQWPRALLGAQLVAATSFAMLAKTTSPLYCTGPGLVALVYLIHRAPRSSTPDRSGRSALWVWWILALVLAGAASVWYGRNFEAALHHAMTASFGPVAESFGGRGPFVHVFHEWTRIAMRVFFLPPTATLMGAFVVLGAARRLFDRATSPARQMDLCAAVAILQMLVALTAFAFSPNRDPRYLGPLLPLMAVVTSWAIVHSGSGWATGVAIGALCLQLVLVQSHVLGIGMHRAPSLRPEIGIDAALSVVHRDPGPADDLAAIARRTCSPGGPAAYNFVGVDLLHLSGHALTYAAAKERLAGRAGDCRYDSIAFGSLEAAEAEVKARPYLYWVTVDPQIHPVPAYQEFLNQSAPVLFRRLRRRGVLEPEPWDGPRGVLLFRFVTR